MRYERFLCTTTCGSLKVTRRAVVQFAREFLVPLFSSFSPVVGRGSGTDRGKNSD